MTSIAFHFDFGSPNAYLSHKLIPDIEQRTGALFEYVPVLLGGIFKLTGNRSPMETFAGIRNKPEYQRKEMERFLRRHRITTFTFNPYFPVNTLLPMRGAVAAEMEGCFEPYVRAVFHHMWEAPKKMDDPEIARAALDSSGLDGARLLARAQEPDVKQRLLDNTARSVECGTFGAPTFFVGGEMFFGKDRLNEVEDEIRRVGAEG